MSETLARTEPIDVHDMVVVHRAFRREMALLPSLVRAVPDGDNRRTKVVAGHARLMLTGLAIHHGGEDATVWPVLHERAPEAAELVATMERQHADVHAALDEAEGLLATWSRTARAADGEALATTLDRLLALLLEHLDLEERELLPVAARVMTDAEWRSLGEHGRERMTLAQVPLLFGAVLEEADAEEKAAIYADMPGVVSLLLRTVGARRYRRHVARVRGGR